MREATVRSCVMPPRGRKKVNAKAVAVPEMETAETLEHAGVLDSEEHVNAEGVGEAFDEDFRAASLEDTADMNPPSEPNLDHVDEAEDTVEERVPAKKRGRPKAKSEEVLASEESYPAKRGRKKAKNDTANKEAEEKSSTDNPEREQIPVKKRGRPKKVIPQVVEHSTDERGNSEDLENEPAPPKKGRGRATKVTSQDNDAETEEKNNSEDLENEPAPLKKGRGRAKKVTPQDNDAETEADPSQKKAVGSKEPSEAVADAVSQPSQKRRGRPPKAIPDTEGETGPNQKKRGRPGKEAAGSTEEQPEITKPNGKSKGGTVNGNVKIAIEHW